VDDRQRLSGYVDVWWGSVRSFTDLLDDLAGHVIATGDAELAQRVLDRLAVTP
jgi:hypothetical protein